MRQYIKTIWETADITGGLYIVHTDRVTLDDNRSITSMLYKIGWHVDYLAIKNRKEDDDDVAISGRGDYRLISMSDGMVAAGHPRAKFAEHLNSSGLFRLATKDEVLRGLAAGEANFAEGREFVGIIDELKGLRK